MRFRAFFVLVAAAACVGGCTSGSVPATAPSTTAPQDGTSSTTNASMTTAATNTTTTIDRTAEITAIFEDLERRRLAAIYSGDVAAFTALFADTPYLDRSLEVFDLVEQGEPPSISIEVLEVLRDDAECLAAWNVVVVDGDTTEPVTTVLTRSEGGWSLAFVSAEKGGWVCDGSHPLS